MKNIRTGILPFFLFLFATGAFSQSGRCYITNFDSEGISVIDLTSREKIADVRTGRNPHGVAVSPDGRYVAVSNEGANSVSVLDAATNAVSRTISVGSHPHQLAFTNDGTFLYVA